LKGSNRISTSFEHTCFFPGISAERLYGAWLDSAQHSAMTGSPAQVEPHVGGRFTAWEGYISGTTLSLHPFRLIVQAWRTTEFAEDDPDSRLEVWLEEEEGGVKLRLVHSGIPEGEGADYQQGWEEYYFEPMQGYFCGE
jgi:activator of HSP90 ATPase